jgi:hypothetical protein
LGLKKGPDLFTPSTIFVRLASHRAYFTILDCGESEDPPVRRLCPCSQSSLAFALLPVTATKQERERTGSCWIVAFLFPWRHFSATREAPGVAASCQGTEAKKKEWPLLCSNNE